MLFSDINIPVVARVFLFPLLRNLVVTESVGAKVRATCMGKAEAT